MRAILIDEKTLPQILETGVLSESDKRAIDLYLGLKETWYAIVGYVAPGGAFFDFTILPSYIFELVFEYDPEKIKTDWDQIVRK